MEIRCRNSAAQTWTAIPGADWTSLEKAELVRVVADQHVFGLLVVVEHHFVVLTTNA